MVGSEEKGHDPLGDLDRRLTHPGQLAPGARLERVDTLSQRSGPIITRLVVLAVGESMGKPDTYDWPDVQRRLPLPGINVVMVRSQSERERGPYYFEVSDAGLGLYGDGRVSNPYVRFPEASQPVATEE